MQSSEHTDQRGLFRELEVGSGRVFVIGDIHGCAEETMTILEMLNGTLLPEDYIVFLGDYIDRGPQSAQVIELLLQFRAAFPNCRFLKGNHEQMLLEFIDGPRSMSNRFLKFGGLETFQSYGLAPADYFEKPQAGLPDQHLRFYRSLELGLICGKFLLVHAGIGPDLSVEQQTEAHILWIREEFVNVPHPLPYTVIFGHMPFDQVKMDLPFKMGIDTGLVFGNMLTCIELKEGTAHQVRKGSRHIKHRALW